MKKETLGRRIRRMRVEYDILMSELCQAAQLTSKALADIEHDRSIPNLTTLCRLADAFEVEPSDFITGITIPRRPPPKPEQPVKKRRSRTRL